MKFSFDIEDENTRRVKEKNKQQKLMTYAFFAFAGLAILLLIIYFATRTTTTKTTKNTQTTPTKEVTPKKEKVEIVDQKSNERPVAVIVDTDIGSNKLAGIQDSYINYEMLTENGKTKILALYKDTEVGIIGPVAKGDHYFIDYALEHKAVMASFGMTEYTEKLVNSEDYDYINGEVDSAAFMQDKEETAHNIYTSTNRLASMIETKKYKDTSSSWDGFKYSTEEINLEETGGKKASYINLKYSVNETRAYKYDSKNKYYLRFNNEDEDNDRKTNEQLHFKNIIIIYITPDTVPRENILNINTVGKGEGYYVTNGYRIPIKWEKSSQTAKTEFTDEDGKTLKVNDGNTIIQIVPGTEE